MPGYVALLRAVNVGGTGKLPMADLKALCIDTGFAEVETYIASGNVVFTSAAKADVAKTKLEKALHTYAKKPVGVVIRTAAELAAILKQNPFGNEKPNYTYVIFLDAKPPRDALDKATGRTNEKDATRQAGDFCLLSGRHGAVEAENSGGEDWNGAQLEHRRGADRDGGEEINARSSPRPACARVASFGRLESSRPSFARRSMHETNPIGDDGLREGGSS